MKGTFLRVYWDFFDELTPEASLLLAYIVDMKDSGLMKKWDGNYFRLSNSFIQERFLTWSQHTIKKNFDELEEKGFIKTKQLFQYENGNKNKTRWVMVTDKTNDLIEGVSNAQPNDLNNDLNNDLPNDLTENFNINKNTITQYHNNTIIYNDETSSSMYSTSSTENNSPDDFLSKKDTLTNMAPPSDPEEKFSDRIKEIVAYLNEKTDSSYRENTPNTRKHIIARLKQCYTVDDFKHVIDVKCAEWKGTEFEKFLRPDTLFGSKFENYLNTKMSTVTKNTAPKVEQRKADPSKILDIVF